MAPVYSEEVGVGEFGTRPVGNGACKVIDRTSGNKLILEVDDSWYNGAPKVEEVVFWIVPESWIRLSVMLLSVLGAGNMRICFRDILPIALHPIIVVAAFAIPSAPTTIAG